MTMDPTDIHTKTFCDLKTGIRKAGILENALSDDVVAKAKEGDVDSCRLILNVMKTRYEKSSLERASRVEAQVSVDSSRPNVAQLGTVDENAEDEAMFESEYECMEVGK